jgi:hypothetical protein
MALYVYGFMRRQDGTVAARGKYEGPPVSTVTHGDLCALVSEVPDGDLALRRESALAHTQTLQRAFGHGPVLPLRFGTVVSDAVALEREVLAPRQDELLARLRGLESTAEMQVKATYLEEPLLRSILKSSPRLAQTAARVRDVPAAASHFDRLALGEAITLAVQARRNEDAQRLVEGLRDLAVMVSLGELTHERDVVNASFLVGDDKLEQFDSRVETLSRENGDRMTFKLIGPMPAYSFVDSAPQQPAGAVGSS